MKSVIPFTKELEFNTKVSEITSISLEREFSLQEESIEGNLHITGEYKSHEVSVNIIPFSFKIPFSIAVPNTVKEDTLSLEISDFAYDTLEENKIKVHIELELSFEEEEKEPEEESHFDESEEIIDMMEERHEEESQPIPKEEKKEVEQPIEDQYKETSESREEPEAVEIEEPNTKSEETEQMTETIKKDEYLTYHIHILKEGETLETICTTYHVTGGYLAEYNDISNLNIGDKILIPNDNE